MFDPHAAAESGFEPEVKKVDGQFSQGQSSIAASHFHVKNVHFMMILRVKCSGDNFVGKKDAKIKC